MRPTTLSGWWPGAKTRTRGAECEQERQQAAAQDLYSRYRKHFAIERLDFLMFREWPEGVAHGEDIDSGPIIWDAGVTATGVGLAAARANGDAEIPVGDAFLAFRKSTGARASESTLTLAGHDLQGTER